MSESLDSLLITNPRIESYIENLYETASHPVLRKMEQYAKEQHFPIIGPMVGRLCQQLLRNGRHKSVFEFGSGFGYSAFHFALAIGEEAQITSVDFDQDNMDRGIAYLKEAGLDKRVTYHQGDAFEVYKQSSKDHDVIFIDAEKASYPNIFALIRPNLNKGNLLIIDNMLWSGKTVLGKSDSATQGILSLTKTLFTHPLLFSVMYPIRDGVVVTEVLGKLD